MSNNFRILYRNGKYRAQRKLLWLLWYDFEFEGDDLCDRPAEYNTFDEARAAIARYYAPKTWRVIQTNE